MAAASPGARLQSLVDTANKVPTKVPHRIHKCRVPAGAVMSMRTLRSAARPLAASRASTARRRPSLSFWMTPPVNPN